MAWDAAFQPSQSPAASALQDCREHKAPAADRKSPSAEADNTNLRMRPRSLPQPRSEQSLLARVPPPSRSQSTPPKLPESPFLPAPSATLDTPPPRCQRVP